MKALYLSVQELVVAIHQVMVRQPAEDTRDRRLVQAVLQDLDSKAVRCLYTEEFQREVSRTTTYLCTPVAVDKDNYKEIIGINVSKLDVFENGTEVTVETLIEAGIVKNPRDGVKILGDGELTKKLTVKVNAFSKSAEEKITAAGGTCEVI